MTIVQPDVTANACRRDEHATAYDLWMLNKGLVYTNIHSTVYPAGEIRDQVLPTTVKYTKVPAPASPSPSGAFVD